MVERVTVTIEDQTTSDQIMSDQGFRVDMVDAGRKGRGARFEGGQGGEGMQRGRVADAKRSAKGWRIRRQRVAAFLSLSLPFLGALSLAPLA